jgi:hypothetical protein
MSARTESESIQELEQMEAALDGIAAEAEARASRFEQALAAAPAEQWRPAIPRKAQDAGLASAEQRAATLAQEVEGELAAVESGLQRWLEAAKSFGERFEPRVPSRNLAARR